MAGGEAVVMNYNMADVSHGYTAAVSFTLAPRISSVCLSGRVTKSIAPTDLIFLHKKYHTCGSLVF